MPLLTGLLHTHRVWRSRARASHESLLLDVIRGARRALDMDALADERRWFGAVIPPTTAIAGIPVVVDVVDRSTFVVGMRRDFDVDGRGRCLDVGGLGTGFLRSSPN